MVQEASMSTFLEAIADYGYATPREIIMDGKLRRFATDANKNYSKDGWYIGFDDATGKAGAFGSWRDGSNITWSNGTGRQLNEQEKRDVERKRQEAFEQAKKEKLEAAQRAKRLYEKAQETGSSGYLTKKGIEQPEGTRFVSGISSSAFGFAFEPRNINALIVPVYAPSGVIATLQIIENDGNKLFMKNGSTSGGWFGIGDWQTAKCIVIAEGIATAQSIHQASGLPVLAAFSAHNLSTVALMARMKNALGEILIAVDGDKAGREGSEKAAKSCGGKMIEAPDGMDWNDVHQAEGIAAVKKAFVTEEINNLWKADLIVKTKNDGAQTIPCRVHNIIIYLKNAPEFKGRIKLNELTMKVMIDNEDIDEASTTRIKAALEKNYFSEKVSTGDLIEGLMVVAMEHKFHPVRHYLKSIKWDGKSRVLNLFSHYFGAVDNEYTRAVSHSMLVSAVARVMEPGCQVDTMIVLEGGQGLGKSTAISTLFKSEWHAEVTSAITDKDFFQNLRGKWVMEFGEMTHITRADSNHIKQVLTIRADNYRASYDRFNKTYPRQNIFVGTTNDDVYLKDATGARRYLPIKAEKILMDEIKADRDQLWAEALALYQSNPVWWIIPNADEEQEKRYDADSWEEVIVKWLDGKSDAAYTYDPINDTSTSEILIGALGIEVSKHGRGDQMRVGAIMKRLKWKRIKASANGSREWRLKRP
jgi:putative DNA primase/helicase